MRHRSVLPIAFTLIITAVWAWSQPVRAEAPAGDRDLLVILASERLETQAMALILANHTLQRERQVHILLCDAAARLALDGAEAEPVKPIDRSPVQLLQAAMAAGADVQVCAIFLPNAGLEPDALAQDITVATPPEIAARLVSSKWKVMSF